MPFSGSATNALSIFNYRYCMAIIGLTIGTRRSRIQTKIKITFGLGSTTLYFWFVNWLRKPGRRIKLPKFKIYRLRSGSFSARDCLRYAQKTTTPAGHTAIPKFSAFLMQKSA
jgi:hypothetical protein